MKKQTDSENMKLWERVCVTDPKQVKPITGKDYGGNSPKPYWIVQRLTEEFGPCGIGWGYSIEDERFERFSETDVLHVAKVCLWYMLGDQRGEVVQMGQTKATYVTSKGTFKVDEDAPKKSVTDALVKCASYLGFAGDIFSGRWDDSKYIAWAKKQYEDAPEDEGPVAQSFRSSATMGALESLPEDERDHIRDMAMEIVDLVGKAQTQDAWSLVESAHLDDMQKMALWAILDSKTRAAIKKAGQSMKEEATA